MAVLASESLHSTTSTMVSPLVVHLSILQSTAQLTSMVLLRRIALVTNTMVHPRAAAACTTTFIPHSVQLTVIKRKKPRRTMTSWHATQTTTSTPTLPSSTWPMPIHQLLEATDRAWPDKSSRRRPKLINERRPVTTTRKSRSNNIQSTICLDTSTHLRFQLITTALSITARRRNLSLTMATTPQLSSHLRTAG